MLSKKINRGKHHVVQQSPQGRIMIDTKSSKMCGPKKPAILIKNEMQNRDTKKYPKNRLSKIIFPREN